MSQVKPKNLVQLCVMGVLTMIMTPAFANLTGGINNATSNVSAATTAFYAFVGACAVGYLLYKFFQAWFGRADWNELLIACVWVAAAGGTIVLAPTLWNWFTG